MKPDFTNILQVLKRTKPAKPTLFELFMHIEFATKFADQCLVRDLPESELKPPAIMASAYANLGYDFVPIPGSKFAFKYNRYSKLETRSLNQGFVIYDDQTFEHYRWPEPGSFDYSRLEKIIPFMADGMKIIVVNTESVFGGVVRLMGYDNLCYNLYDNESLVAQLFNAVGARVLQYNRLCLEYDAVGAIVVNDDWGFKTQTMISAEHLRKYVVPWHKKIVKAIHDAGRLAIMHSCGNLTAVMDDVIDDIGYDAKHSFEDSICPIEAAYDRWGKRIALLGGIDIDFLCRRSPSEIKTRAAALLKRTAAQGGYALGSGNSIPRYIPEENFLAMINVVQEIE